MKLKIYPQFTFLDSFLKERKAEIVVDKPQVVHYFGDISIENLKKILAFDKPDLLITHNVYCLKQLEYPQVYCPASSLTEFLDPSRPVITNAYELCKLYLRSIGVSKEIRIFGIRKKPSRKIPGISVNFESLWTRLKAFMSWR